VTLSAPVWVRRHSLIILRIGSEGSNGGQSPSCHSMSGVTGLERLKPIRSFSIRYC